MVAFNNFFVAYTLKSIKAINIDFCYLHGWSVKQQVVQYRHMSHINYDYVYFCEAYVVSCFFCCCCCLT